MKKCSIKYLLVLALFALVPCAFAATIKVSSDDLVDGKLPLKTIVANASDGDEIVIATGTYMVKESPITLNKKLMIRSETGTPGDVVLKRSEDWAMRFDLNHAEAVLRDLTLDGSNHRTSSGIVLFPQNGAGGTLLNCVIRGGNAYESSCCGGVNLMGSGTVMSCIFDGNKYQTSEGAALCIKNDAAVVRNCLIKNCDWAYSQASFNPKGAVYISAGLLENCTIAGNQTKQYTGIYATGGTVRNCLVGGNTLSTQGVKDGNENIQVYNSGNATFEYCAVPEAIDGSNIHVVAEPFADADYRPAALTSVLNVGLNQPWMTDAKDLDGNDRIINGTVDIGAYESSEMPDVSPAGVIQIKGANRGVPPFDVTFTAVLENCGETSDISYKWNFGDGGTEDGTGKSTVTHRFETVGEWKVSLVVDNETAGVTGFTLLETASVYANAKTMYVAPAGAEITASAWPYATPETAAVNLRTAVECAADENEIVLLKGHHFFDKEAELQLTHGIVLRGETGKPEDVVLLYGESNGVKNNWNNRFFTIHNDAVVIRDLTLDGDSTKALPTETHGRLVYMVSGGMVTNCVLRNVNSPGSQRSSGGAVFIKGPGIVSHCVISNCSVSAIMNGGDTYCRGNAVYLQDGRLEECLLIGNYADYNPNATDWTAPDIETGGTVAISGGEVVNCTIVGNSAYDCAGVYAIGNKGKVVNTIIAGNVSEYVGEGATATAAVWKGKTSTDNSVFTHCFSDTLKINDNCPDFGDPLFKDAANGDYRLTAESPCVNAGTTEGVTLSKVDLAGQARSPRKPDIGCYESPFGLYIILR